MHQSAILDAVPAYGRHLTFRLDDAKAALASLAALPARANQVVGLGQPLVSAVGGSVPGLKPFPAMSGPGVSAPSTQEAVWAFVGGRDASDAFDAARELIGRLAGLRLVEEVPTFVYREGRDLTGYVDGTENPKDDRAVEAALVRDAGDGLDDGSFVAVQRWVHDLAGFAARPAAVRDAVIGRRQEDDVELSSAPPSAHVKRTAQESFDPPAFMVRRSMPWSGPDGQGLMFVAYGRTIDAYERAMQKMLGQQDGVVDALMMFSKPVTGAYYWCPPLRDDRLDLRTLER